jgi:hypothetical protein
MRASRRLFVTALTCVLGQGTLAAQTIRGSVVLPDSTTAASGAIVVISDASGAVVARGLTAPSGNFAIKLAAPGSYAIRVLRIGVRPTSGPVVSVTNDDTAPVRVVLSAQTVTLSAINVRDRGTCRVDSDTGLAVTRVWEEARKAMLSSQLQSDRAPLVAEWIEYDRHLDSTGRIVRGQKVRQTRSTTTHAFKSRPAAFLDSAGYVVLDNGVITYHAPDADVLLSDLFAAGHCFRLAAPPKESPGLIGVAFTPARDRDGIRDIQGTVWVDRASAELRWLEFRYTRLSDVAAAAGAGGRVDFQRLVEGSWLISRWNLRMPQLEERKSSDNGLRRTIVATQPVIRAIQVTGGEVTRVTRDDSVVYSATGPRLAIQVVARDSLVAARGAIVTLVGTDYRATANEAGAVVLSPILAGRYAVHISTPFMDSVGLAPTSGEVEARLDARVDSLRLPSARDVLLKVCPRDSVRGGQGMLLGSVRDARDAPVPNAAVVVTWQGNFDIVGGERSDHVRLTEHTLGALSDANGSWRICGVPRDTMLVVRTVSDSGRDTRRFRLTSELAAVLLVARRGETNAQHEMAAATGQRDNASALVELSAFSLQGAPLADVTLEVRPARGAPRTVRTGQTGRALLPAVEPGVLEIRARRIGFAEGKIAATVEAGRNTVPIIMSQAAAPSLDTVRVVGNQRLSGLSRLDGFEQRRRTAIGGRFITRENIETQHPVFTVELLRRIPGINVRDSSGVAVAISARGMKTTSALELVPCMMRVAVDGIVKEGGFDLNSLQPNDIHGVEVYTAATVPPQFNGAKTDSFCGLIMFWTR